VLRVSALGAVKERHQLRFIPIREAPRLKARGASMIRSFGPDLFLRREAASFKLKSVSPFEQVNDLIE